MKPLIALMTAILLWDGYLVFIHKETPPKAETTKSEQKTEPVLQISEELGGIFPQLADKTYIGQDLRNAFYRMNSDGNKICNMLLDRYPEDTEFMSSFSPKLFSGKYSKMMVDLISGCYNFFRMNDVQLQKTIDKVNALYSDPDRACYSVGFSQIYLLSTGIKCKHITAIDVDWRILWAHFQVMESLSVKGQVDFNLLHIGWSADFSGQIKEMEPKIGVNTFCYATDKKACSEAFKKFPALNVGRIDLQLGYLHQVDIQAPHELVFFYVSNALDPGYTSKSQFETFLRNIQNTISYKQKVVIIYHSGGNEQFAIYEAQVYPPTGHLQVKTVCRDDLTWSSSYSTRGQTYETYLDKVSVTSDPESCSE